MFPGSMQEFQFDSPREIIYLEAVLLIHPKAMNI